MKNILIACISQFSEAQAAGAPITYTTHGVVVQAHQTNEACIKHLMLTQKDGISNYIRVLTNSVAQKDSFTLSYLDKSVSCFCAENSLTVPESHDIKLGEDEAHHRYDRVLSEIAALIRELAKDDEEISIYLDMAGGKRDNYVFIQLLTKLLSFYGYAIHTYYSDLIDKTERTGAIVNTDAAFRQMKILDAVNEFVLHGTSAHLRECFKNTTSTTVKLLLKSMENFSNAVQLCSTNLSDTVRLLEEHLYQVETYVEDPTGELYVIKTMIPLIREKFHITENNSGINTLGIIRWCLENGLVQQALTIYNENVSEILFSSGLLTFKGPQDDMYSALNKGNPHATKQSTSLLYIAEYAFKYYEADRRRQSTELSRIMDKFKKEYSNKKDTMWTIGSVFLTEECLTSYAKLNIDIELFRRILIDTRYAKIRRNTINHAYDKSNYPDILNNLFKRNDYGYSATDYQSVTPKNIIKDMLNAVQNIENAILSLQ